jgi:hypothetical protein
MAMTLPTLPNMPAGYVATAADMNNLAYACTFLLTKPVASVQDTNNTQVFTSSPPVALPFNTKNYDTDGMWSSGANNKLTIQTPGWYKFRYTVFATTAGGVTDAFGTYLESTTGANNPAGAGVVSSDHWHGYTDVFSSSGGAAGASGIWPFYLYAGDFLQLFALGLAAALNYTLSNSQSYFQLEYVSLY